jgi:hypothetical protein
VIPLGENPLLPLLVTRWARWRSLGAGHVANPARAPNPGASWHLLPSRIQPGGRAPLARQATLGFSPSWVRRRGRKREGEVGEKKRRSEEGEAAPVTLPACQDRRLFVSAGSRTSRCGRGRSRPRWRGSWNRARTRAPLGTPTPRCRLRQATDDYTFAPP